MSKAELTQAVTLTNVKIDSTAKGLYLECDQYDGIIGKDDSEIERNLEILLTTNIYNYFYRKSMGLSSVCVVDEKAIIKTAWELMKTAFISNNFESEQNKLAQDILVFAVDNKTRNSKINYLRKQYCKNK